MRTSPRGSSRWVTTSTAVAGSLIPRDSALRAILLNSLSPNRGSPSIFRFVPVPIASLMALSRSYGGSRVHTVARTVPECT